ncbi:MAG: peptidylprolyl isomerase [candidate division KSB1 bacterium]|nr:peptidylprolyl isomerase [candidate division KSB1 bacterium]
MKRVIAYALLGIAVLGLGCEGQKSTAVVRVGKQRLDVRAVVDRFRWSREFHQGKQITPEVVKEYVDKNMLWELLFRAEGFRLGLQRDSLVLARIEAEKRDLLTMPNGPLYRAVAPKKLEITEADLHRLYAQLDQEVLIAQIVVKSARMADSLYQELRKGADFARLARQFSADIPTALNGGQMTRYYTRGYLAPPLEEAAFSLSVGEISRPVKTAIGYHIVKLIDKRGFKPRPYAQVRRELDLQLRMAKTSQYMDGWVEELFKRYRVTVNDTLGPHFVKMYVPPNDGVPSRLDPARSPGLSLQTEAISWATGSWRAVDLVRRYNELDVSERVPFHCTEDFVDFAKHALFPDLLYQEAKALRLDTGEDFAQRVEEITQRVVFQECRRRLVTSKVQVSEDEALEEYERNKETKYKGLSFVQARARVYSYLVGSRTSALQDKVVAELRSRHKIRWNQKALQEAAAQLEARRQGQK